MTRSVWNTKFIRLLAEHMKAGKTKAEICDILGLTPKALQIGTYRFKTQLDNYMTPKAKKVAVEEPVQDDPTNDEPPVVEEEIAIDGTYKTLELDFHVRLYAVDGYSDFPVHGAIRSPRGWESCSWTKTGHFSKDGRRHIYDLVKALPEEKSVWVWQNYKNERKTFLTEYEAEDFKKLRWGMVFKVSIPNE
jgi:hypothetical protein